MKKILILLLIFFLTVCCSKRNESKSGNTSADSVAIYIANASNINSPPSKRIRNNRKAFRLLTSQNGNKSVRDNLQRVSSIFYSLKSVEDFKQANGLLKRIAESQKDSLNLAKAYNLHGNFKIDIGQNDSAFIYFVKAEKLLKKINDSVSLGKNYIDKAFAQLYENDFSGCEISSIQALAHIKNFDNKRRIYDAYNLIGISSNELKNYDNAINYHNKALTLVDDLDPKLHLGSNSRNNIGVVYQNLNQHQEAINSFKLALKDKNLLNEYPSLYAIVIDNLAYSKFKIGDNTDLPKLFFESLKIREANGMSSGVIANKIHLSEYFEKQNDTMLAKKYAVEALQLAESTKVSGDLLGSLKQLSIVERENASQYHQEYIRISDSIQIQERIARDKFARIAYETEEVILENDKLAEQNRSLAYFFMGTLFIGVLLFVIRTQRARNRELLLKQAQQKANEDIYNLMISQQNKIEESRMREKKRIAQELHDGVLGRLFGARLNLDSLNKIGDEEAIIKRNNYLSELKNIEQDIREISHDLNREKYVLINNFIAILNNLIEEQKTAFESDVTVQIDDDIKWDELKNSLKINLYRIIQESLQNINKYAKAKTVKIVIRKTGDNLILSINDDGEGFNVSTKKRGIGLQNMVSRTQELEGTFDIRSKKGKGTTITASFPTQDKISVNL